MGAPLHDTTFCVVDLETTGGSPLTAAITEVGAVKLRAGACLGTFQTLVNPGTGIPPEITFLTGITEAMVAPAPPIETVLPSLLEFLGDSVVVGHNVRFDLGFLDAALRRSDRPRPTAVWAHWPSACAWPTGRPTAPSTTPWPPATCSTCCSSGPGGSESWASTTCWPSQPWPATPRWRSCA